MQNVDVTEVVVVIYTRPLNASLQASRRHETVQCLAQSLDRAFVRAAERGLALSLHFYSLSDKHDVFDPRSTCLSSALFKTLKPIFIKFREQQGPKCRPKRLTNCHKQQYCHSGTDELYADDGTRQAKQPTVWFNASETLVEEELSWQRQFSWT